jgi:hypothetical protein
MLHLKGMAASGMCAAACNRSLRRQEWAASILRSVRSNTPTSHSGKFELDPDKTFTI